MAKTSLNPVFEGFSRSIGNITFYTRNGETLARRKSEPRDAKTPAQMAVRKSFIQAALDWKELPSFIKRTWDRKTSGATAYNFFMGKNVKSISAGEPSVLCIKGELSAPLSLSAASAGAGKITISYQLESADTDRKLSLFYRTIPSEQETRGKFTVITAAAELSGSVALDNCTDGSWYEFHAVVTDADPASASKTSASIAIKYRKEQ